MVGQVKKVHSDAFYVSLEDGKEFRCASRGNLKKEGRIIVGDYVDFDDLVISRVHKRKNSFIRPNVSNIETVVIVVSPTPEPDFLLIDKLLLNALSQELAVISASRQVSLVLQPFLLLCWVT